MKKRVGGHMGSLLNDLEVLRARLNQAWHETRSACREGEDPAHTGGLACAYAQAVALVDDLIEKYEGV